jgi:predicted permease
MQDLPGDVRYAIRQLARAPGFTTTVLLTLALGVGGTTSIFSCVYGLLLKGLPFTDADRIVTIADTHPQLKGTIEASFPEYLDWRTQQTSFSQMAAYADRGTAVLSFDGKSQQVHQVLASGDFFTLLGTGAQLGRVLQMQDNHSGSDRVAVLSATAWQHYFGGDPQAVGRTVNLNDGTFTIIGVLPSGAAFPAEGDVWLPLSLLDKENQNSRVYHSVNVLGRLRAGVTLREAHTQMQTITQRLALAYPATSGVFGVRLEDLREKLVGPVRPALLSVMGAVLLLLIVACANVANLLLVRATAQQREITIRQALGADRRRLFSQFFTQTMVLCLAGGILGTLVSLISIPLLKIALARTDNLDPQLVHSISLSIPVLLFSLGVCMLAALIFGLLPMGTLSCQLANQLRVGEGGSVRGQSRSRMALISAEVAIAVMVVFMSSLVIRSFNKLLAVEPGFRTDQLVSAQISLPEPRFTEGSPATDRVYEQILAKIAESPGIVSVATTTVLPLRPSVVMSRFLVKGEQPPASGAFPAAQIRAVSPSFFQTMGLSLQAGRLFEQKDIGAKPGSFIVNQAFASRYLTDRNPVGATILMGVLTPKPDEVPVIGVVADAHDLGVAADPQPEIYSSAFGLGAVLLVRSSANMQDVKAPIQAAVRSVVPGQPIYNVETMTSVLSQSLARQRTTATLLGIFALTALLLAAVGIYGVLSYSVAQRTREIGVRMALGASRSNIVLIVVRQAAGILTLGTIAGLVTFSIVARLVTDLLFGIHLIDPTSVAMSVSLLILVAFVAAVLPAIRAASASPREALRAE